MSESLDVRAEITKLARLLGVATEELAFLVKLDSAALIEYREQLVELLYGGETGRLKRFVAPSKVLPTSVIAMLTREAVGPVIAARVAGLIDVKQAIAVVAKLPDEFVADISVELDPRRVGPVIAGLPGRRVAAISAELARREEYVAMGRFVAYLGDAAIAETFEHVGDADLLRSAFVFEDKDRLSAVTRLFSDERLGGVMNAAAREHLFPEALDLLDHLDDEQYLRVIDLIGQQEDSVIDELIRVAHAEELWDLVLPIVADMADADRFMAALIRSQGASVKSFVSSAREHDMWDELREPIEKLTPERRAELRKRLAQNRVLAEVRPVEDLFV